VSRYQKGKTNLDFTEARDSEWQWYQLGHMQVCTSLQIDQIDNHAVPHQMSAFKAKMHLIRFRLGLRSRPRWGNLQRSPDPVAGLRGPTSEGRGKETGGKGKEGVGMQEGG